RFGDWMGSVLPSGFQGLIALVRNWTFTIFYVISELWAVVVMSVLYWGFANDFTRVDEAKRTYGILTIGATLAPPLGGGLALLFTDIIALPFLSSVTDQWNHTICQLISLVSVLGLGSMGIYFWINKKVLSTEELVTSKALYQQDGSKKGRLSLRESL